MEQMILSENNKQTKNRNRAWPRRADLVLLRGREWERWAFWDFGGMQTIISGMDGQWDPTVQHREMCVVESLFCTTELDETL